MGRSCSQVRAWFREVSSVGSMDISTILPALCVWVSYTLCHAGAHGRQNAAQSGCSSIQPWHHSCTLLGLERVPVSIRQSSVCVCLGLLTIRGRSVLQCDLPMFSQVFTRCFALLLT